MTVLEILTTSFSELWGNVVAFLPSFIAALIVFIVGWIIASILGGFVVRVIRVLYIEKALKKLRVYDLFERVGVKFDFAGLIGWLVKWFVIVAVLTAVADILRLGQITEFLKSVVLFIPNVVIAVVIFFVGILVANFVHEVILETVKATKLHNGAIFAGIARWAILIFTFMTVLVQLRIGPLIEILFTGLVFMLALAGGLAFGLGGKEWAEKTLRGIDQDIRGR